MNRRALFLALCALVVAGVLSALGTIAYLAHIRALASDLITSAREIRTKADAEREIAAWRKRSGENFWQESDHLGGDHNYDAQIDNSALVRLRIVEPTVVTVGITMRDGRLRCVTVIESTGWYPVASVWINESFEETPNRLHVGGHDRPHDAAVEFPSSLPEEERLKAFAINTKCLTKFGGCKTADDILPGVWQLQ